MKINEYQWKQSKPLKTDGNHWKLILGVGGTGGAIKQMFKYSIIPNLDNKPWKKLTYITYAGLLNNPSTLIILPIGPKLSGTAWNCQETIINRSEWSGNYRNRQTAIKNDQKTADLPEGQLSNLDYVVFVYSCVCGSSCLFPEGGGLQENDNKQCLPCFQN